MGRQKRSQDRHIPGLPKDTSEAPIPGRTRTRLPWLDDPRSPWGLRMLNRPVYLSFWILLALAGAGTIWLFWQALPGYSAVLGGLLLVAIVGGVLKESIAKDPPYRF